MLKNANVTTLRQVLKVLRRFSFALDGLKAAYRSEQSFRIQLAVSVVVVLAGGLLGLTQLEWLFVMKGVVAGCGVASYNHTMARQPDWCMLALSQKSRPMDRHQCFA